ncbi:MAG TPA: SusD/RagB family nutrient-binding outer membrane lipoprotein [Niastella sp.]|nr:SusD/RagB family nutrient-binding outer membrane lipoprotein [Niastella sp.]
MKRLKLFQIPILILLLSASACKKKYDDYLANPNRPEAVPPSLLFTSIANELNADDPWSQVTRWSQFDVINYNYYGDQRYDWTGLTWNFNTLNNVQRMETEAQRIGLGEVNTYSALAKFFKAFFYYRMTSLNGDLPLSEALKGIESATPKYDTQKALFLQILTWLEEANADLDALKVKNGDTKIEGDFYFGGNGTLSSWQKVVNAFQLRVLVALSKREDDADLKIKERFVNITITNKAKYPLPESEGDNLQYIYNSINKYPSNPDNLGFDATRYNMSATYLNTLVRLNDPRVFITAEPATAQLKAGKTPADIMAYNGAPSGEDLTDMSSKMSDVSNAAYSLRSRSRYYSSYNAEPGIIIGYAELCFNMAEAIQRGWITDDAEAWYKQGIKSSLLFYGIPVAAPGNITKLYPYNTTGAASYVIPFDFEGQYYQQAAVKYKTGTEGLQQILLQKYLAFFQNSGWEAYFNQRRTGVPVFLTGTGTGNGGRIPKRFQYPASEQVNNTVNWKDAIERQFGGTDDINGVMWLIK